MFDQRWVTQDAYHANSSAPGSTDLSASRYVWLLLTFDPVTETAMVTFHQRWNPFAPPLDP